MGTALKPQEGPATPRTAPERGKDSTPTPITPLRGLQSLAPFAIHDRVRYRHHADVRRVEYVHQSSEGVWWVTVAPTGNAGAHSAPAGEWRLA